METVVVGVDGSEGALDALRFAARQARETGARLRVVCAWHVPPAAYGAGGLVPPWDPRKAFRDAAAETIEEAIAALGADAEGVEVERVVAEGQAAKVLVEASRDADLLVVGSRGRGGFTGLLLGSVSQECAHHAPCPVVIVPPGARSKTASPAAT